MSSFDLWPFDDVRTVERRGDLEVLQGTSPDGVPVTITRIAPDVARDATLRERFRQAVDAATRQAGPDDPPVLWADTATLVPWAATYDDEHRRGADLITGIYQSAAGTQPGAPQQYPAPAQPSAPQQPSGEHSVPALEDYQPPVTHHTGQSGYPPQGSYPSPPPVPGGPPQPQPPQRSRAPKLVAFGAGGLVLVLLLGMAISLGLTRERATGQPASESPTSVPTQSIEFSTGPSGSTPTPSESKPTTPPAPKLKSRKPVSVYGPVWKKGDDTFTMAYYQLGWAFRAPGDFDCLITEKTETKTRVTCTKILDKKPDDNRRVLVIDRQCSGKSCSKAEQKTCATDKDGYKPPLKRKDSTTQYNTTTYKDKKTKEKSFAEFMLHYYKGSSGHRNKCVLVYVEGALGEYAKDMQKTVNSIRTQTG